VENIPQCHIYKQITEEMYPELLDFNQYFKHDEEEYVMDAFNRVLDIHRKLTDTYESTLSNINPLGSLAASHAAFKSGDFNNAYKLLGLGNPLLHLDTEENFLTAVNQRLTTHTQKCVKEFKLPILKTG